jgi:TIR domain
MHMAKLFISYSHRDERPLDRLHTHLAMLRREGAISAWYDREILAGENIDNDIDANLTNSDIFFALVSPDFLASKYCYEREMAKAIERHDAGSLRVIPIILEPCDWTSSPLGKLKALPKDGKPISTWTNQNVAFLDIVEELRRILKKPSKPDSARGSVATESDEKKSRRYRIKREFDAFDRDDFRKHTFSIIRDYFRRSTDELNEIGDLIKARFEVMGEDAFSCTVLNKGARNKEAHITIHGDSSESFGGEMTYSFSRRAPGNTANGFIRIESDEYELFPRLDNFSGMMAKDNEPRSPELVAEALWRKFISQAGIDHD